MPPVINIYPGSFSEGQCILCDPDDNLSMSNSDWIDNESNFTVTIVQKFTVSQRPLVLLVDGHNYMRFIN